MTKYYSDKNKFVRDNDTPISIGGNWYGEPRPSYICDYCQRSLSLLTDRHGLSPSWYCSFCQIESNPDEKELRSKSKISMSEGPTTTPLASTNFKEPTIGRKPVEPKGAFAALRARGIKITSYSVSNTRREKDND